MQKETQAQKRTREIRSSGIVVTRERSIHFYGTKDKEEPTAGFLQPCRLW